MPSSDRGIRSKEESVAIERIRPEWYRQKNKYGRRVGRRYRKRELRQGLNGLSVRMSILPPLSGCSCSRVGHSSTQEQERPDSRPQKQWGLQNDPHILHSQSVWKQTFCFLLSWSWRLYSLFKSARSWSFFRFSSVFSRSVA